MQCPNCQLINRESAKFCKDCGTKLENLCPKCDSPYEEGVKFCDECGQNLAQPLPSETSPPAPTLSSTEIPETFADNRYEAKEFLGEGGEKELALKNLKIAEKECAEMGIEYWLDRTRKAIAGLEG